MVSGAVHTELSILTPSLAAMITTHTGCNRTAKPLKEMEQQGSQHSLPLSGKQSIQKITCIRYSARDSHLCLASVRCTVCTQEEFWIAACGRCGHSLPVPFPLKDGQTEGVDLEASLQ